MKVVKNHLEKNLGCRAIVDKKDLDGGVPFDQRIMEHIDNAHLFLSILTKESNDSSWAHQEIGYAKGKRIPIIPLAVGQLPDGLVRSLHAVEVRRNLKSLEQDLEESLTRGVLDVLLDPVEHPVLPYCECASHSEERTQALVSLARKAMRPAYGRIRVMAAYSSFSIPREDSGNEIWNAREGKNLASTYARKLFQSERLILQEHAENAGCDLILKPDIKNDVHTDEGRRTRLRILSEFLKEMRDRNGVDVNVVLTSGEMMRNIVIVGDSFFAEAVVPFGGARFENTLFVRHAPTILNRMREFDSQMHRLLNETNLKGRSSVDIALQGIERLVGENR